jgi:hypothetical protein
MLVFVNHLTAVRITGTRLGTAQLSFADALVGSEFQIAGVAELADALDSKSSDRKIVWVRAPPPANSLPSNQEDRPKVLSTLPRRSNVIPCLAEHFLSRSSSPERSESHPLL